MYSSHTYEMIVISVDSKMFVEHLNTDQPHNANEVS